MPPKAAGQPSGEATTQPAPESSADTSGEKAFKDAVTLFFDRHGRFSKKYHLRNLDFSYSPYREGIIGNAELGQQMVYILCTRFNFKFVENLVALDPRKRRLITHDGTFGMWNAAIGCSHHGALFWQSAVQAERADPDKYELTDAERKFLHDHADFGLGVVFSEANSGIDWRGPNGLVANPDFAPPLEGF